MLRAMHPVLSALRQSINERPHLSDAWKAGFTAWIDRAQEILDTAGAERFAEFWKLYPRKTSKDASLRAWVRMEGDRHFDDIIKNVQLRLRMKEWDPRDPARLQYIPHASTYLNQRRWLDAPQVQPCVDPTRSLG